MTLPGDPLSPLHLRLGNIVLRPNRQPTRIEYLSVHFHQNILERKVSVSTLNINHGIEGFTGLPIDEKWLSKLGFEKVDEYWRIGINEMIIYPKSDASYGLKSIPSVELNYVHQLQNLMFAIRGFENQIFL